MKNMTQNKLWAISLLLLLGACDNSSTAISENLQNTKNVSSKITSEVVMYKSPTCGCCTGWAEHLRKSGFTVVENKRDNMDAIKSEYGVPEKLSSCHTALIDGYIIEGHVPAADVERLLKERPNIAGLTAPGMPMKSPGMQAVGQKPQGYDVLAFDKNGKTTVFQHYQ
ncbi:MAG: DUF411 domain-containing protein [Mariprofundaceae bacterium]|nr:DUF411 domain-containing protein [Mariprofundaceae bacterium]